MNLINCVFIEFRAEANAQRLMLPFNESEKIFKFFRSGLGLRTSTNMTRKKYFSAIKWGNKALT